MTVFSPSRGLVTRLDALVLESLATEARRCGSSPTAISSPATSAKEMAARIASLEREAVFEAGAVEPVEELPPSN